MDTAAATLPTAFGKRIAVEVVERDGQWADIIVGGKRARVNWTSLDFAAPVEPVAPVAGEGVEEPGLYEADGTVYKVQRSKTSGHLYAKRLILIGGKRLTTAGEKVNLEYEYAPGAMRILKASDRMDLDTAKRFGIEYGICIVCGAFLKDADSVEAGIGPVCRKRF